MVRKPDIANGGNLCHRRRKSKSLFVQDADREACKYDQNVDRMPSVFAARCLEDLAEHRSSSYDSSVIFRPSPFIAGSRRDSTTRSAVVLVSCAFGAASIAPQESPATANILNPYAPIILIPLVRPELFHDRPPSNAPRSIRESVGAAECTRQRFPTQSG